MIKRLSNALSSRGQRTQSQSLLRTQAIVAKLGEIATRLNGHEQALRQMSQHLQTQQLAQKSQWQPPQEMQRPVASAWPGFTVAGLGAMVRPMVRMARPMMRPMVRMARPMFKMAGKLMAAARAKAKAAGLCSGEACTPEEIARWLPWAKKHEKKMGGALGAMVKALAGKANGTADALRLLARQLARPMMRMAEPAEKKMVQPHQMLASAPQGSDERARETWSSRMNSRLQSVETKLDQLAHIRKNSVSQNELNDILREVSHLESLVLKTKKFQAAPSSAAQSELAGSVPGFPAYNLPVPSYPEAYVLCTASTKEECLTETSGCVWDRLLRCHLPGTSAPVGNAAAKADADDADVDADADADADAGESDGVSYF